VAKTTQARKTSTKAKSPSKGSKGASASRSSSRKPVAKPRPKPASKVGSTKLKATPKSAPKPASKPRAADATKAVHKPATTGKAPAGAGPSTVTPAGTLPGGKPKPKGITIVTPKPIRKPKPKKVIEMPSLGAPLLGPGTKKWKPLIPSGPNAKPVGQIAASTTDLSKLKSPFSKKDQERFREVLLRKRAELAGDVKNIEGEALQGNSGSLSHMPQHMAEQGTESFDQALNLDIAAVDRSLIREIDDALARIENGTYGLCEMTRKPISRERLEELPWTRFSIEAARELERRTLTRGAPPPAPIS
jgi:RNA polymerase-binding transcription factor DksA